MVDPHSKSTELAYLSAHEVLARLENGTLTSTQLVTALIERINAVDADGTTTSLHSIAAVHDEAINCAKERDDERTRGISRGPLHGVPVIIKDNIEAIGLPGLAGSTSLIGRPTRDAPLVTNLKNSGAIILASTNLSEWANIRSTRSSSGWSATGGLVANPWALDRSAGGSSSGSGAALAAGLSPLAVGTETDGSITCPASLNGVVGLKPTVGSVSRDFVIPISPSQDSPGPMARSVDDVELLFSALSASNKPDVVVQAKIVMSPTWMSGHPETDACFKNIVDILKITGTEVAVRDFAVPGEQEGNDELHVLLSELVTSMSSYLSNRPGTGVSSLQDVVDFEDRHKEIEQKYFAHELFDMALEKGGMETESYMQARERNLKWAVETCLTPGLDGFDVVISPAYGPAWKTDLVTGGHPGAASPSIGAAAIAGWPILSVPMGLVQGLPVGLCIIGRPHSEWQILQVAKKIEQLVSLPQPFWQQPSRN
jgi:amidase